MTFTNTQRSRGGRGRPTGMPKVRRPNVLTFMPRSLPTSDGTAALAPARHWTEPYYTRLARAQKQQTALMIAPCTSIVPYGFWQSATLFVSCNEVDEKFTCQNQPHVLQFRERADNIGATDFVTPSNAPSRSAFSCIGKEIVLSPVYEAKKTAPAQF